MRKFGIAAAAFLVACAISAHATGWYCPVLGREFDFPWGWSGDSAYDPNLTMDSKYAIMATDAGLDFYNHWMKWQPDYIPANQQQLVAGTVDDKMLSRNFMAGIYTRFATLINDDYRHTYVGSGGMTNEVLALAYNVEMGYNQPSTYFVVDDLRHVPTYEALPNIGGSMSPEYAVLAVSNAIHDILGIDATRKPSFTSAYGDTYDIGDIVYAKNCWYTWGLAYDNRAFNPPECLQAGSFYPVVLDPFKSYLRHAHYLGNDIPQMFMHCKGKTPFTYTERKDVYTSTTTYLCELTTNADNSATLKLTYVLFGTSTSNEYVHTRQLCYGDKVSGQSEAQGSAYGIGIGNLKTRKAIIGEVIHREVYIPSTGQTKYCLLYPCGYAIDEERTWGEQLDYDYVVTSHYITKQNSPVGGFPAATSAWDWGQSWTLYNYNSDGSDYYGNPASYDGKGIAGGGGGGGTTDPYYADFWFNSREFDSDIYNMSEALHTMPSIEVYYDQGNPEFTFPPITPPTAPDMCLVVSVDNGTYSTEGWMYTNTWNFVEDQGASWLGAGPPAAEIVYPYYYEKDGDWLYELFPWELPFHFYVDMFASWISNKWGMWE